VLSLGVDAGSGHAAPTFVAITVDEGVGTAASSAFLVSESSAAMAAGLNP